MGAFRTLSEEQERLLGRLLRNESDTAYRRRVRWVLRRLAPEPGQAILDVGTGMGFYLKAVSALWPDVPLAGLDLDTEALAYAKAHLGDRALLARARIEELPFADGSFDRIILSEVLKHLDDDAAGLQEVVRVLAPGGLLAITVPPARFSGWFDPLNRALKALRFPPVRRGPLAGIWANHVRLYAPEELYSLVRSQGLRILDTAKLTHYCFPGSQFLVYTVGKTLLQRGLLPEAVARSTDRFRGAENRQNRWNPLTWALGLLNWADRWNEHPGLMRNARTFVNLAVLASKD
jgi:SAM-dependent methyltransferase